MKALSGTVGSQTIAGWSGVPAVRAGRGRCQWQRIVRQLLSNWAYMVITSLAWTMKSWFALCMRTRADRDEVLGMEFRRFLHTFVLLPCQLVRTGRKLVYRRLGYNPSLGKFFSPFHRIKALRPRPGPLLVTG